MRGQLKVYSEGKVVVAGDLVDIGGERGIVALKNSRRSISH